MHPDLIPGLPVKTYGFCMALGFLAAFFSGLLACRAMIALVKKARLSWFSVYCVAVAILIFLFA